jgi:hypothetical protein
MNSAHSKGHFRCPQKCIPDQSIASPRNLENNPIMFTQLLKDNFSIILSALLKLGVNQGFSNLVLLAFGDG